MTDKDYNTSEEFRMGTRTESLSEAEDNTTQRINDLPSLEDKDSKYGINKPKRIPIRARIINDTDK